MTLNEAIKHAEEVAEEQEKKAIYTPIEMLNSDVDIEKCQECAAEHRQLAEWLKELKQLKEQTDYKKYIRALRKCAKEHENDNVPFAHIRTADLCNDTADLLEKLEGER